MTRSNLPAAPFWKILGRYSLLTTLMLGPLAVMGWLYDYELLRSIFTLDQSLPATWEIGTNDLTALLLIPMALWGPFAFFPVEWCKSEEASHRRQVIFAFMVIIFLLGCLVVRFTTGYVLDAWLHPKGYVECKLDPKKRWNYSRNFVYGLGPDNCEFGVRDS